MYLKYPLLILLFSIIWCITGCEAPRDNPVDPSNPNNPENGVIEGIVQSYSVPYTPIPNVQVYWSAGDYLAVTDTSGKFVIRNIRPVSGNLVFHKEGYKTDTIKVLWNDSQKLAYNINLKKVPLLDSISIYTVVVNNSSSPLQSFDLFIAARVEDSDKSIDSVYVKNDVLNFRKKLDYNVTEKIYQATLSTAELKVQDLEETIGLDFNIYATDVFSKTQMIGSGKVTRVIKSNIGLISPTNSAVVDSMPTFNWVKFTPGYPFQFMVEVYTNDIANSQLVFRKSGLTSEVVSYKHNQKLAKGEYYWVLWVIDKFQNRARSAPAIFIVQ